MMCFVFVFFVVVVVYVLVCLDCVFDDVMKFVLLVYKVIV